MRKIVTFIHHNIKTISNYQNLVRYNVFLYYIKYFAGNPIRNFRQSCKLSATVGHLYVNNIHICTYI